MDGVIVGRHTALYPSEKGQFEAKNGYPGREKISVVLLGVRNNSYVVKHSFDFQSRSKSTGANSSGLVPSDCSIHSSSRSANTSAR